jgi:hypothetical protein
MKTLVALLLALGPTAVSTAAFAKDCEEDETWDEDTQTCVPAD